VTELRVLVCEAYFMAYIEDFRKTYAYFIHDGPFESKQFVVPPFLKALQPLNAEKYDEAVEVYERLFKEEVENVTRSLEIRSPGDIVTAAVKVKYSNLDLNGVKNLTVYIRYVT
jgi:hypothetical protein